MKRSYTYLFLLTILVACAQLGLVAPQTFDEKLTASLSTVTALRDSTLMLINAKKISSDDAQHVQDQLNNARSGIDVARTMSKNDPTGAATKLTSIHAALVALQTYLASKEK